MTSIIIPKSILAILVFSLSIILFLSYIGNMLIGAIVGMLVGITVGPIGMIIGSLIGACIEGLFHYFK